MGWELSAVAAITPALLLVWYFHKRDIYPEPPRVLWTTFSLGVLCALPAILIAIPFYFLGQAALTVLPGMSGIIAAGAINAFLSAAMCEEACKLAVLLRYNVRRREFSEPMDGIVYGAVVSLGFAAIENVLYAIEGGIVGSVMRAFTAVPMHACVGAIMGAYLARARSDHRRRNELIFQGYLAAFLLHGLYDFPLLALRAYVEAHDGDESSVGGFAALALILALIVLVVAARGTTRLVAGARREQEHRRMIALYTPVARPVMPMSDSGAFLATGEYAQESPTRRSEFLVPIRTPPADALKPPLRSRAIPATLTAFGAVLTCCGGAIMLAALVRIGRGALTPDEWHRLTFYVSLLGLVPALVGVLLFSNGVRRLNAQTV